MSRLTIKELVDVNTNLRVTLALREQTLTKLRADIEDLKERNRILEEQKVFDDDRISMLKLDVAKATGAKTVLFELAQVAIKT